MAFHLKERYVKWRKVIQAVTMLCVCHLAVMDEETHIEAQQPRGYGWILGQCWPAFAQYSSITTCLPGGGYGVWVTWRKPFTESEEGRWSQTETSIVSIFTGERRPGQGGQMKDHWDYTNTAPTQVHKRRVAPTNSVSPITLTSLTPSPRHHLSLSSHQAVHHLRIILKHCSHQIKSPRTHIELWLESTSTKLISVHF